MSDLIDRQAAIEAIYEMHIDGEKGVIKALPNTYGADLREIVERIEELPSAQPEIIRCKDCRHNGSFDTDCPIDWKGKEYCSFAER